MSKTALAQEALQAAPSVPITNLADSILGDDLVSMATLLILLVLSVMSWALIIKKGLHFYQMEQEAKAFSQNFRLEEGLKDLRYRSSVMPSCYLARQFEQMAQTYDASFPASEADPAKPHPGWQRTSDRLNLSLEKAIAQENASLEKGLTLLASISSAAPFIGLFGTVAGVIDALFNIGAQGISTIGAVAPGISAALVATACGLFVAIPALVAFNLFRNQARQVSNRMRSFGMDLLTLFDQDHHERA